MDVSVLYFRPISTVTHNRILTMGYLYRWNCTTIILVYFCTMSGTRASPIIIGLDEPNKTLFIVDESSDDEIYFDDESDKELPIIACCQPPLLRRSARIFAEKRRRLDPIK